MLQLLPTTRDFVEQVLAGHPVPQTLDGDIEVGVLYLRHLLDQFDGDRAARARRLVPGRGGRAKFGLYKVTKPFVADVLALAARMWPRLTSLRCGRWSCSTVPLDELMAEARTLRDAHRGRLVTYSPKVFIPLTKLCRDVCHYCTFARPPRRGERAYMTIDEVLEVARAGERAGCREALFTLGDKPELRYRAARDELAELGFATTLEYLARRRRRRPRGDVAAAASQPGRARRGRLRAAAARRRLDGADARDRLGTALARAAGRTSARPTSFRRARLETLRLAGEAKVPFTTGILIGIGETREERLEALRAIAAAGPHVQEVIVQNFRAKPGTRMAAAPEPPLEELLWTIAAARLILPPEVAVQAPPNLTERLRRACSTRGSTTGAASRR